MEEEPHYVSVVFKTNGISTHEKPMDLDVIYEEVKNVVFRRDTNPVISDKASDLELIYNEVKNEASISPTGERHKTPLPCPLIHLLAAGLGIVCVLLVSVIVILTGHLNTVISEQRRDNMNLTEQSRQLWTDRTDLERQTGDLSRERDGLNWTMGVILQYDDFPVSSFCPRKVCKPCLDDWVLFESNCYLFYKNDYYHYWQTWERSREQCRQLKADLAVIDSQKEQEFINNHTTYYNSDRHGYWIGLNYSDMKSSWMWIDGGNVTLMYWKMQQGGSRASCALTLPRADPPANWQKTSCDMKNRWVCETRALIKQDRTSNQPHGHL